MSPPSHSHLLIENLWFLPVLTSTYRVPTTGSLYVYYQILMDGFSLSLTYLPSCPFPREAVCLSVGPVLSHGVPFMAQTKLLKLSEVICLSKFISNGQFSLVSYYILHKVGHDWVISIAQHISSLSKNDVCVLIGVPQNTYLNEWMDPLWMKRLLCHRVLCSQCKHWGHIRRRDSYTHYKVSTSETKSVSWIWSSGQPAISI